MEISKSYPYHSIAKKHGVDYGIVLAIADFVTHDRMDVLKQYDDCRETLKNPAALVKDIQDAATHYKAVRSGSIPFGTT